jgi:hypothetical protein
MPLNKSWHDYNESLIERGRVLIDVSFLKSSNKEIKKMNIGKVGAPFQYSDSYVRFLAFLKIGLKIPSRMVQGIVRGLSEYVKIVEEIHFTHIRKRMIGIKPSIENDNDNDNELRRDEVLLLKKLGYEKWKQIKDAGRRWIAEIVFSSIKRVLGEDLFSKKFSTQKVEAGLKIMLYNKFISL